MRSRAALLFAAVVALGSLLVACTAPRGDLLPPPSSTSSTELPSTTTQPDYSQIALERLPGETTVPPLETDGRTTIRGSVSGPDGAVAGAVVRIQRLVGGQMQQIDVRTGENGGFVQGSLPGGRFRIRAFQEPSLTTMEPEVFYLVDGDDREVRFDLRRFDQIVALPSTTPPAPVVGGRVNLAVRIARQQVDGDGVVHESPLPGVRVRISSSGWALVGGAAVDVTDGDGVAVFEYRCDQAGAVTASVVLGESAPEPDESDDGDGEDGGGERGDGEGDDGNGTTTTVPEEAAGGAGVEQQTISLDVPDCAPRPTTTTAPGGGEDGGDGPTTTTG